MNVHATQSAELAYLAALRLSNIAYNVSQHIELPTKEQWDQWRRLLKEDQDEWDKGSASLHAIIQDSKRGAT